jgi:mannosyltransferase OCH1-like enzyme
MIVPEYTHSSFKKVTTAIINAGTSEDNVKRIKLNTTYKNPKLYPRKFEKWPDKFSAVIENDELVVRRTDVSVGGWGETLLIDVEFDVDGYVDISKNQKIPKVIYQTFEGYDLPKGMFDAVNSWINTNPDYEHYFFDEKKRRDFIETHFDKSVLDSYLRLLPGAFRADLWRCCVLYIKGGVYVDADMICLKRLNDIIDIDDSFLIARDDPMSTRFLANGFIASTPNHPFLKKQIDNIVDNVQNLRERYYLDVTGPGLFGKSVNEVCGRTQYDDFNLGIENIGGYTFKVLQHDYTSKSFKCDGESFLISEYGNKVNEMNSIGNKTFYSMYLENKVYQLIPNKIFFTTYDKLGINTYMYESFKNKNKYWTINHFDEYKVESFFKSNSEKLQQEFGVNVYDYYKTLSNGGEKSDLWRYCIVYLEGGVYSDADTFCNKELKEWVLHHDLIFGLEANLPLEQSKSFGMDSIGTIIGNDVLSVCNWTFAAKPKHEFFKGLIKDIITNPIRGNVLLNTGPGRLTKHVINYFNDCDFSLLRNSDITKENSILFNINKFGSNQSHSGSIKNHNNSLDINHEDVYVIHKFEGSWRRVKNKQIKKYKSNLGVTHNMTIYKTDDGYTGIARLDKDTTRTLFMKKIGDCRSLMELKFDNEFNLLEENEKEITKIKQVSKFEDYRHFKYKNKDYYAVSYIDGDFNTFVSLLNSNYEFLGNVNIPEYNKVSWMGDTKIWEKNWLFFEKDGELYFIYSTTPRYIIYKCVNFDVLLFEKHIDIEWPLKQNVPNNELYFTSHIGCTTKIATGGSCAPIYLKEYDCYLYFIHTKIYNERRYNHFAILIDKDLKPFKLIEEPIIKKYVDEALMFVSSVVEVEDYFVFSGGVEDNTNFIWELSKGQILKLIGLI